MLQSLQCTASNQQFNSVLAVQLPDNMHMLASCCFQNLHLLLCSAAGMEEHQLKELAYTIFFGACGKRSNAEHVQVMRAQLEVGKAASMP